MPESTFWSEKPKFQRQPLLTFLELIFWLVLAIQDSFTSKLHPQVRARALAFPTCTIFSFLMIGLLATEGGLPWLGGVIIGLFFYLALGLLYIGLRRWPDG